MVFAMLIDFVFYTKLHCYSLYFLFLCY